MLDPTQRHPVSLPDGTVIENLVYLDQVIDHPNIRVGAFSYFNSFAPVQDYAQTLAPYLFPGAPERLEIGRFCQLAHGALFITASANHPMTGISTYPFAIFEPETMGAYSGQAAQTGDTVIGHDVWIGHEAVVMPGISVGSGAIIAARAVVTRDVAPYTIVGGNPARVIRPRVSERDRARLLDLAWWDWPTETIAAHQDLLGRGDLEALEAVGAGLRRGTG